jgi:hypothetical protein
MSELQERIDRNKAKWERERNNFAAWKAAVIADAQNKWEAEDMRRGYCVLAPDVRHVSVCD